MMFFFKQENGKKNLRYYCGLSKKKKKRPHNLEYHEIFMILLQ